MNPFNAISTLGLILDLIGALFLGIAFFKVKYKDIKLQSISLASIHPLVFNNINEQQAFGKSGTVILGIGFIEQLIGNLGILNSYNQITVFKMGLIVNIVIIIGLYIWKNHLIKINRDKVILELDALTEEEQKDLGFYYRPRKK